VVEAGLRFRAARALRRDPDTTPASGPAAGPAAGPTPAPAPGAALTLGPEHRGLRRLRVTAPGAALVEVMGDCTGWRPIALLAQPDGSWAAELPLAAGGVYHLQLRIDGGAWRPPPGLPTLPDGFAGTVGVLVVDPD
jgi:hypothetical protein